MTETRCDRDTLAYLAGLSDLYKQAEDFANQLVADFSPNPQRDGLLTALRDNLACIAAFEESHAGARSHLLESGSPKTGDIQRELTRVRSLIERTLRAVTAAEKAANDARAKLTPQLDEQSKARRVRAAYGKCRE